jgi:mono/diheme cytochrome c family protein
MGVVSVKDAARLSCAALLAACALMPAALQAQDAGPAAPAVTPASSAEGAASPDLAQGREVFQRICSLCHGAQGEGGIGPMLQGISQRLPPEQITRQILEPHGTMPRLYPTRVDAAEVANVAAYLQTLKFTPAAATSALASSASPASRVEGAAPPDPAQGRKVFQRICSLCHGVQGEGGVGPVLQGVGQRLSSEQITHQILEPRGAMPRLYPTRVDAAAVANVVAYLQTLK